MENTNSETEAQVSDLLLSALLSGVLRAAIEIKTVAIALRDGWITPEYAMTWLHDIGLVDQVIVDEVRS